jgi:hypothetical protein|tara:strand:+ start:8580 stop:9107 length:528 start_codon:yes stop_codon:yes gene_type:complete
MLRPDIQAMFYKLNVEHFNNEIPDLPVVWNSRMTTTAGRCHYRRRLGNLTPIKIDMSYRLFRNLDFDLSKVERTLIHEMVHAYLCHKYNEKGHTARFQRMMTNITGEHKNHRCHDYDVAAIKRTQSKKVKAECQRCGMVYYKARMPKHAAYSTYTHKGCGGTIKFSKIEDSVKIF